MKRLIWADSLKGILIVLVVLGHAIQETLKMGCFDNHVWNYIYSFHMPAFMAISGFVSFNRGGYKTTGEGLKIISRRFQQLMIPFIIWALIRVAFNPSYTIDTLINIFLYPDGSYWFLWVLFFISVFFVFGNWLSEKLKIKQEWVMGILCLLLAVLMVFVDIRFFGFQFIAYYFLFYTIGYYLHKYNKILTDKTPLIVVLAVLWFVMAWFWNMHKLPNFLSSIPLPQALMQYAYRFLTAFVAIYVLFGVSPKVLDNNEKWNSPMLRLGKISLGIYTTHILLMPFVVSIIMELIKDASLVVIIAFLVALAVSWLLVWLMSKWKITARLLLGKL